MKHLSWEASTLAAVARQAERSHDGVVLRQDLLERELDRIIAETQTIGATPAQTLSRVLQTLRDQGQVRFLGGGRNRLVGPRVIVELADHSPIELSRAAREGRLFFADVVTESAVAITRRRVGQDRLREVVLELYSSQCALCDVSDNALLVCSHIVRWADDAEHRGRLDNVMCLCRMHDALFEAGYWGLDSKYHLIRKQSSSQTIKALLSTNNAFRQPRSHPPSQEFLSRHLARVGL